MRQFLSIVFLVFLFDCLFGQSVEKWRLVEFYTTSDNCIDTSAFNLSSKENRTMLLGYNRVHGIKDQVLEISDDHAIDYELRSNKKYNIYEGHYKANEIIFRGPLRGNIQADSVPFRIIDQTKEILIISDGPQVMRIYTNKESKDLPTFNPTIILEYLIRVHKAFNSEIVYCK